ncbi:uracil-DNA glycosylase [Craterilacuibacter sp.]|uniref:uracil-DNA glycosylase n=1 Tax=Craterilacuibacter sp. TaxID=2870909 RepID=UPI003F2FD64F
MSRRLTLVEAMGIGPLWHRRNMEYVHIAPEPAEQPVPRQAVISASAPPALSIQQDQTDKTHSGVPIRPMTDHGHKNLQALSWNELKDEVARCRECPLCDTRTQTVFGRGNPQARWLFIGEAPGEDEDLQGEAFAGRAGMLLDNILQAAGLDKADDVYITNMLKCRPPINRNPQMDEINACHPYLAAQIALLRPALIVTLGRFASQTLLQSKESIASLRGRVHDYQGIPVIASFLPAYLLRNQLQKAAVWQDILRAKDIMKKSTAD